MERVCAAEEGGDPRSGNGGGRGGYGVYNPWVELKFRAASAASSAFQLIDPAPVV